MQRLRSRSTTTTTRRSRYATLAAGLLAATAAHGAPPLPRTPAHPDAPEVVMERRGAPEATQPVASTTETSTLAGTAADAKTQPVSARSLEAVSLDADWTPSDNDALAGHHARSLVDMSAGLGMWAVLYWIMMDRNVADWDNPEPLERFDGRAWRFDNNSLGVNWIAHPLMGGASYAFARANHHDPAQSFGYSFLTSFLWEFVLEFKEKVSVNDVIATPGTGVPIGEFVYKLGLYLDTHEQPGPLLEAARWSIGVPVTMDRALDGRAPPRVSSRDNLGLTKRLWHRFELRGGALFVDSPQARDTALGRTDFAARLVTLPDYLAAVDSFRFFYMAEISDLSVGAEGSRHGAGMTASADTLVAGFHTQQLGSATGHPRGTAATAGISVAYRYIRSRANEYSEFREAEALPDPEFAHHVPTTAEQFAALHLPGPAFDWQVLAPGLSLYVGARAHPDFVGFGAPAFYDWAAANLEERGKHILHRQGYFHGWGGSGEFASRLRLGPLMAAGSLFYGRYRSQDGLDRHIERLTRDVPARGALLLYGASIGLEPPLLPLILGVDFGVRHWTSEVDGSVRRGRSVAKGFSASFEF